MDSVSKSVKGSVVSDSLRPHGLQHARLPCSSPIPRAYSNSCPSSQWWHPTISSSVIPFFFHLQSIQHQGLFQLVSSSYQVANVLEFQLQHQSFRWIFRMISFRTDWFDLLAVQGTLKSLLQHHSLKASILWHSAFFIVGLSHPCMTTGKTITLTVQTFVGKVMVLCNGHVTEVRTTSPFVAWVYVTDRNIGGLLNRRMRVGNSQKLYIRSLWREPASSCDF